MGQKGMILKSIGFPLSMLQTIDKIAYQKKISRSDLIRQAVEKYLINDNLGGVTNEREFIKENEKRI